MIELTDADRAFIRSLADKWHQDHMLDACREAMHYGLAAGIERAANICGEYAYDKRAAPELRGNSNGAADCAAAIRALNAPAAP